MTKYDYIKCPYCDNAVELKDCPDFWSNEKYSDYKKQEKILKRMQKCGFNVVTCGICGGIVLVEKENIRLLKENNLMTKDCINCEKETILKYSDLQIKLDRANCYITLLEKANDIAQQLNQTLREDNEQLRTKLNNSIEME